MTNRELPSLLMWCFTFSGGIGLGMYATSRPPLVREVADFTWRGGENVNEPAYETGYHYVTPLGQNIEIRGEHKYPLHVRDNGAVEIETRGAKVLVVVHPPDDPKNETHDKKSLKPFMTEKPLEEK